MSAIRIVILVLFLIGVTVIDGLCNDAGPIELTLGNYQEEFMECEVPVVVYVWASWCKPCKLLSPIVERLAIFYGEKAKFIKVDADGSRKLLNEFRPLRGLPVLIFYKNGEEFDRILGFVPFLIIYDRVELLLKGLKPDKKDDCNGGVCPPPN